MVSVRGGGSEECPKLLSLKEETPLLALPDKVELLPSRPDCGLVGDAGIGWRGDCLERNKTRLKLAKEAMLHLLCWSPFQLLTVLTTAQFHLCSECQGLLVYMYGSTTCGQISALNNTRAVRETAAEVMIGVLKSQHMVQKKEKGKTYNPWVISLG